MLESLNDQIRKLLSPPKKSPLAPIKPRLPSRHLVGHGEHGPPIPGPSCWWQQSRPAFTLDTFVLTLQAKPGLHKWRGHPVLSCPVLSCPVLSCPVLSCPVLFCPVLSCPVLTYHRSYIKPAKMAPKIVSEFQSFFSAFIFGHSVSTPALTIRIQCNFIH
jgi:hypothetical protein